MTHFFLGVALVTHFFLGVALGFGVMSWFFLVWSVDPEIHDLRDYICDRDPDPAACQEALR